MSLQLAADSTEAAGDVEFRFPPVQVPIRTVRRVRTDGAVRLSWLGGDEVAVGGSLSLTVKVEKGRGLLRHKRVDISREGNGSVAPESGLTDGDGLLATVFTAPASPSPRCSRPCSPTSRIPSGP